MGRLETATSMRYAIVCVLLLAMALGACASAEGTSEAISEAAATTSVTQATTTTEAPATTTTEAPATTATTTTRATTTTAATRPATAEEAAPMQAFIDAYAAQDPAAMAATFAGEPSIEFTIAGGNSDTWSVEGMQQDAAFSAAAKDSWRLDECTMNYGRVWCHVDIQDELGRRLGLDPVRVTFFYSSEGGLWTDVSWDAFDAFQAMDLEAHTYGDWYDESYPDLEPIQGYHYRAWNVEDPTAGDRYLEALVEYLSN